MLSDFGISPVSLSSFDCGNHKPNENARLRFKVFGWIACRSADHVNPEPRRRTMIVLSTWDHSLAASS